MTFDGRKYDSARLIQPAAYHPHNPFAGDVFADALIGSYHTAQNQSRIVMQQTYGMNGKDIGGPLQLGGFTIGQTAYTRIGEANPFIYSAWTHIRGQVLFGAQPLLDSTAYHRVVADDGTTTETGPAPPVAVRPPLPLNAVAARRYGETAWEPNLTEQFGLHYTAEIEVTLKSLTLDQEINVYVEGYVAAGATATSYKPFFVSLWLEMRD